MLYVQHQENRCLYIKLQCMICYDSISASECWISHPCRHGPMCQNCRIRCMEKCPECRTNLNRSTPFKKIFLNYVKKWLPIKITSWKLRLLVFIRFNKFRTFFYGFMYFGAKLWGADPPRNPPNVNIIGRVTKKTPRLCSVLFQSCLFDQLSRRG